MSEHSHIEPDLGDDTSKWLEVLSYYDLIEGTKNEQDKFIIAFLSQKGKVYLTLNPELKNPSFWDDKHAVIDHVFSLIGLIKPF
jgi:hypothetical protein